MNIFRRQVAMKTSFCVKYQNILCTPRSEDEHLSASSADETFFVLNEINIPFPIFLTFRQDRHYYA